MIRFLLFALMTLLTGEAWAYHHFIGYGYSSCMTCHYNAAGGGPLNDYGRGLFATEITSRWIFPKSTSEDRIVELSRFLAVKDLPYWIRPGIKTRDLQMEVNPGSSNKVKRWIPMQREVSLALAADQDQKYLLMISALEHFKPRNFSTGPEETEKGWAVRDAYLRVQVSESNWVYAGQMDKVFGTREIDHTAYSRAWTGLTQFDQSVGVMWNGNFNPWEFFLNGFTGNMDEKSEFKYKGYSGMVEYEPFEKFRVGASVLSQKNDFKEQTAFAIHERLGIRHGNALSLELGAVDNKDLTGATDKTLAGYGLLQTLIRLDRGFNFLTQVEWGKPDLNTASTQLWKFGAGFLIFPLPRTEFRLNAQRITSFSDERATPDSWILQWQTHFSL